MIGVLLFTLPAGGAEPSAFPLQASVELPAAGAVRIRVPYGLRSPDDPSDGSDFLLVDGSGDPVPFARLSDAGQYEWGDRLSIAPGDAAGRWTVEVGPLPADALDVLLPTTPSVAQITVSCDEARR